MNGSIEQLNETIAALQSQVVQLKAKIYDINEQAGNQSAQYDATISTMQEIIKNVCIGMGYTEDDVNTGIQITDVMAKITSLRELASKYDDLYNSVRVGDSVVIGLDDNSVSDELFPQEPQPAEPEALPAASRKL